ncbi:MAG: 2-oxoacid:acceptor oxidoreductase family protein [Alphaproteobacteria bacterium]|nr:2-oxoacid:acceptor oxidoreductase family protein [Alphaproteobacteria bacterium]
MFRIRFHGRGGQGMKTASRILGTAFFLEGFEVQDAPRYGAERRGAPIFAYVRADKAPIYERGVIDRPGLVIVADDTLMGVSAAGVMDGVDAKTVLLVIGGEDPEIWRDRLKTEARILTLKSFVDEETSERPYVGAVCAGAAARLVGVVSKARLEEALTQELEEHGKTVISKNLGRAREAYDTVADDEGIIIDVPNMPPAEPSPPDWVDLPLDPADVASPSIYATATSVQVRTGLWRTMRPVLEPDLCKKCVWVCGSLCPDGVISADADGYPEIDYDHCKGCMICVVQCPPHALTAVPEGQAQGEIEAAEGAPP